MKSLEELKETIKEIEEVKKLFVSTEGWTSETTELLEQPHPYHIGQNYLIRTVTMIITGKLRSVYPNEMILSDACWIADTGRFSDNLKSCEFEEVEPFVNDVVVGRGSIIDATTIGKLPRNQK